MTVLLEPTSNDIPCDVCIVGTGPVGIALALECERAGLTVLALEAGGQTGEHHERGDVVELRDPARHAPMHIATRRAFGGTSWAWSGCCTPFDDIDFDPRPHVPHSGWPLAHSEILPFYARAAEILNCNPVDARDTRSAWGQSECAPGENLLYWSRQPKIAVDHWLHFAQSKAITVCLNSPVVAMDLAENGNRVAEVTVRCRGRAYTFRPPVVVLAAGGLRTTQLMLATQRRWPQHFGGEDGALGRYYMGHLTGWISSIKFKNREIAEHFSPGAAEGVRSFQRRLTISKETQLSERLLNIAFWPAVRALYDPAHADGTLSAAFLALGMPGIGTWLLPGPVRRAALGPKPRRIMPHLRNTLRTPVKTALEAAFVVARRLSPKPATSYLPWKAGGLAFLLQYHAEAEPKPDSRVTLSNKTDSLGLPQLRIDLRFSQQDVDSVVRAHDLLDVSLRQADKGDLEYLDASEDRAESVREQATDGYHQLGLTRMGSDPRQSVVDRNCKVHGVDNLFVASGSVFPTSGQANPTLLAVALALRLARHLSKSLKRPN